MCATAWRDLTFRDAVAGYQAMEYLPPSNRVQEGDLIQTTISATGKHVVIIGGAKAQIVSVPHIDRVRHQ